MRFFNAVAAALVMISSTRQFVNALLLGRHFFVVTLAVFTIQLIFEFDSPVTRHLFWAQLIAFPTIYFAQRTPRGRTSEVTLAATWLIFSLAFVYNLSLAAFHFLRWGGILAVPWFLLIVYLFFALPELIAPVESESSGTKGRVTASNDGPLADNSQRPMPFNALVGTLKRRPWWLRWRL